METEKQTPPPPESVTGGEAAVQIPSPTAWPFLLALGLTLVFASLVTNAGLAYLGIILTLASGIGWFRQVLPHEIHETITVPIHKLQIARSPEKVARIEADHTHRAQLPIETFSVLSGIKGGIAGGIAMIVPAEIYGILRFHSIWYVVNLLGGAGVAGWTNPTLSEITHFRLSALVTAGIIHVSTSLLVGLLYGAMLPIWPKRPVLLGGLIAPLLWTGVLHSALGIVNPFLDQRIDWWSFAASQVFFGLVAGITVLKLGNLKRLAQAPLPVRLGIETPGLQEDRREQQQNEREPQ